MLADMLNAPVTELSVGYNVNVGQYFLDTRSLNPTLATYDTP